MTVLLFLLPAGAVAAGLLGAGRQLPRLSFVVGALFRLARLLALILLPLLALHLVRDSGRP